MLSRCVPVRRGGQAHERRARAATRFPWTRASYHISTPPLRPDVNRTASRCLTRISGDSASMERACTAFISSRRAVSTVISACPSTTMLRDCSIR